MTHAGAMRANAAGPARTRAALARLVAGALVCAGCSTGPDSRPQTFEYVTLEVLAPACALVACHSTTTRVAGYAFDTLEAARGSLHELVSPGHPEQSDLYAIISTTREVMPPDAPLADEDIALIRSWIAAGAPGL